MQTLAQAQEKRLPSITAGQIFALIKPEMERVEAEFARLAQSNVQVINYLGEYLRASGGKRVRPALLIMTSYAAGARAGDENVIRMATVMEMLHTATLVHDDIIDNAELRRSRPSVNSRFGNQTAVLMGDWLYMSAFETALEERSLEILDILTNLTRKMTEGELIQLTMAGKTDIDQDQYFDILRRKTAYLFAGCCEIGAILGGADVATQSALRDYGMNLGIAFQLADDLLDFTSDENALGKASGADLLEGKVTLPLILLMNEKPGIRSIVEDIMHSGTYGKNSKQQLLEKLTEHGTLDKIRVRAQSYAANARKNLDVLPKTEYRSALDEISGFVVGRKS